MKKIVLKLRFALAALLVVGLAACGGTTTVPLSGSVTGLITSGLVVANIDGQTVAIPANATSYMFPKQIDDASSYGVSVQTQPPRLTCAVSGGIGTATGVAINAVNVYCSLNAYTVGGTISGYTETDTGLSLTNGADTLTPTAGATSYAFGTLVSDGSVYGVAVLTQPKGKTCTVANGTAYMGAAPVTNVAVTCQ